MKLFIGAPAGEMPESAIRLSKKIMLPIKQDNSYSSVCPVFEPEAQETIYEPEVALGFCHTTRVVDEFNILKNSTQMLINFNNQKVWEKPLIQEQHLVIFKNRFNLPGKYVFDIVHSGSSILFSGEINVIDY